VDELTNQQKTVYDTILTGVAHAFFPSQRTSPAFRDLKQKLSTTLDQIADIESLETINASTAVANSRVVIKQVLDTVREYSNESAFQDKEKNKWLVSRIFALAKIISS
jgi:hypothetical protein